MKININTIYKKNFFIATLLFSGIFFLLFNIGFNSKNNFLLESCYGVECTGTDVCISWDTSEFSLGCLICGPEGSKTQQESVRHYGGGGVSVDGGGIFFGGMTKILLVILKLIGFLIGITVSLISLSIDPAYSNMLFDSPAVYSGWKIVRDFLNIFFVFFLLFSAFATVFQVQSYHIKKTWVLIIVMALLVNFSWPVTRVIVDFTNVVMAEIIGDSGEDNIPGSGMLADFSDSSKFTHLMIGDAFWGEKGLFKDKTNVIDGNADGVMMAFLFGIGIGLFILFTLFTISLVLMARTMLLVILLIFAPIGYVLLAFPATKSYANGWWNLLFKQAFIGPILVFLLFLSTKILGDTTDSTTTAFSNILTTQVGSASFEAVASILLAMGLFWTAILAAQKMSGQTANLALSGARKARGMAVNGMKGSAKRLDHYGTGGRVGGFVERHKSKIPFTKASSDSFNEKYQTTVAARKVGVDPQIAKENKKKADKKKEYKDKGMSTTDIANEVKGLKGGELDAAVQTMIANGDATAKEFKKFGGAMGQMDKKTQTAFLKHSVDKGQSHNVMDKNTDIIHKEGNKDGKTMSLVDAQKASAEQIGGHMNYKNADKQGEIYKIAQNTISPYGSTLKSQIKNTYGSVKGRQDVMSKMDRKTSNEMKKVFI